MVNPHIHSSIREGCPHTSMGHHDGRSPKASITFRALLCLVSKEVLHE